jgi:protein involved in polysaccharide export with SLBB domain
MASVLIRNNALIRVSFDKILKNEWSKDNFTILDGDEIIINAHPNIVTLVGEVNTPGNYKYYANKNLRGYIKLAGGLTVDAEDKEIRVAYPDGTSRQLRAFMPAPRIYDGSIITVGTKEEVEPFDGTEYAKEITTILANLAQVLLLYAAVR